ncbi:Uncharacterised protein [Mycobacteroides abscessus subsp. massiliense]|nr:Uncharacterised protein [Mycobacteroides abscessus subsp. massiliense]
MRPPHHLNGRNTVAPEIEKRIVNADPVQAQNLGIDPGQDLFDKSRRGAVMIDIGVFRCG